MRKMPVMFCDMEGFTNLSERLAPEEAYSIMDQVYEILIHKLYNYGGTVNEMCHRLKDGKDRRRESCHGNRIKPRR
jgi:class 3 adenylate cyclase